MKERSPNERLDAEISRRMKDGLRTWLIIFAIASTIIAAASWSIVNSLSR